MPHVPAPSCSRRVVVARSRQPLHERALAHLPRSGDDDDGHDAGGVGETRLEEAWEVVGHA